MSYQSQPFKPGAARQDAQKTVAHFRQRLQDHSRLAVPSVSTVLETSHLDGLAEADSRAGTLTVNATKWPHLTPMRRKMVVAHELAHLRHQDTDPWKTAVPTLAAVLSTAAVLGGPLVALQRRGVKNVPTKTLMALSLLPTAASAWAAYSWHAHHKESRAESEAIETLEALGYSAAEIRQGLPPRNTTPVPWYQQFISPHVSEAYYEQEAWRHFEHRYPEFTRYRKTPTS